MRRALPLAAEALLALALYTTIALAVLYPAWLDLGHAVIGDWRHPDMISNHWLYRWVPEQLLAGESLLHNTRYYFPVGDAPWLAGNGSDAVLSTALAAWLPWPGSVTAWCVLLVVLNGVGGHVLARSRGARVGGALVAGAMLATLPYVAHEMMGMRLSQAPLYWFALFLAAWMALLDRPRRVLGLGLLAAVLYALTAFVYWYHGLWAALAGALLFALRPNGRALAVFAPVAAALTLPPLWLFLSHWDAIPGTVEAAFPHPLATEASLPLGFPLWTGSVERAEVVVPWLLFGLVGVALWGWARSGGWRARVAAVPRWAWGCLLGAGLFGSLALGPELLLPDGTGAGVPGPFLWVYAPLAPLRRFWWPYRHVVPMVLLLLPLAGRGVDQLVDRLRGGRLGRAAAVVVPAALLLWLPLELDARGGRTWVPVSWWEPPPVYEAVSALPGEAILELPVAPEVATSQQTLSYQWVHGKALVNGHAMWVDRVRPDAWDAWVAQNTFLARLQEFERGQLFGPFAFSPEDVVALREAGVRHLVVNAEYYPRALYGLVPLYDQVFTPLFGAPVFVFRDQVFAWDLERYTFKGAVAAPDFRLPADYLHRDGSRMLDLGHNRAQGWRTVARLVPPVIPPAAEVPAQDGGEGGPGGAPPTPGAVPQGGLPPASGGPR